MATIVQNIQDRSNRFEREPETSAIEGAQFQAAAIAAVLKGRLCNDGQTVTFAWDDYMRRIASNEAQLMRLRGKDPVFSQHSYAEKVLAYIVGNGICGVSTRARTIANLTEEEIESLDDGIDPTPGTLPAPPPQQCP
jgi:hypothetical protein